MSNTSNRDGHRPSPKAAGALTRAFASGGHPGDVTDEVLAEIARDGRASVDAGRACIAIRSALMRRSVRPGAVPGSLTIDAKYSRRTVHRVEVPGQVDDHGRATCEWRDAGQPGGRTGPEDAAELRDLLGLEEAISCEAVTVPDSNDHRIEYIARAEGREPPRRGR